MCSESLPKEFEKSTEVLPFTKYGISTFEEFKQVEDDLRHHEWLIGVGLTNEEIKLYQENEAGLLQQRKNIESDVLEKKLEIIRTKITEFQNKAGSSEKCDEKPSTSKTDIFERLQSEPLKFYPEGHPMNNLKQIEDSLFGHLNNDKIIPITKRRKLLRRFERKKQRLLTQGNQLITVETDSPTISRPGSLWDVKDMSVRVPQKRIKETHVIGPKKQAMYTIKDNKVVRLEPIENERQDDYRAVDIVMPINSAEEQLLEGTKMSIDDIKKIERFQDYNPGIPSKVLYLKNIASSVSQEQLSLLFNQFQLDNGGPVDVRLMTGRMRGQAFVAFHNEDIAIQALDEINGTILSGRPIIAEFGRNSNRIQDDHR